LTEFDRELLRLEATTLSERAIAGGMAGR